MSPNRALCSGKSPKTRRSTSCGRRPAPLYRSGIVLAASELDVILSACRTPVASFGGALKDLSAADLGAFVVREAIARSGVAHKDLGGVVLGCVLQAGAGMNV